MRSGNPSPHPRTWMRALAWAMAIGLAIRAFHGGRLSGHVAHPETSGRVVRGSPLAWIAVAVVLAAGGAFAGWRVSAQREKGIAQVLTGGDPARAPPLIRRYGCAGCHTISGVSGADGQVGAPLDRFRQRVYIAGVLRNTPDNLRQWIVSPQAFNPRSAMPASGITETEARDVAAFLYSR